ncbi:LLM class flavin-dependent oxidoreductase [Protaetiibacter larvae]|uniref:LLM class flavin-dependent oxidoreductase n=1 Tax=Protaetiibacter larvae TaxID=2592654 RepID=A0A5C1YA61_9MICO|nr:LLM class flavin-dependent oxidoreductase [Protaetiibacter larvae]QEO09757.1 LLM class flavin-dependent oxidoreductase [Protaetiibacter larvae]
MKSIGYLSFGHWSNAPYSQAKTGADTLIQAIELAEAAEEIGVDGAYFRVHHFARQHGAPYPLLAAIAARTSRIEIGTGVIDFRYENPLYSAEEAAVADLISGGRLQLGISRGSPEQVIDGFRYFGYQPADDDPDGAQLARDNFEVFLKVIQGGRFAEPNPHPMFPNPYPGPLGIEPQSPGLIDRIWWGAGNRKTAEWAAELGVNLQSSTLVMHESDEPFHVQQRKQIEAYRAKWKELGHAREPRVSVSRSIFALVDETDWKLFGRDRGSEDQIGKIPGTGSAIFGRSYAGSPDQLIEELKEDEAIQAADTLLLTIPSQLGVDYNAHALEAILTHVAPGLGWR